MFNGIQMKVIVMSDTHLRYVTPEFEKICNKFCLDADMVIHLGDWISPQILDYMMQFELIGISGNSDHPAIVEQLPFKRTIKLGNFRFGLIHGWGWYGNFHEPLIREFERVDGILFGHTHQPVYKEINSKIFINPGSVFAGRGSIKKSIAVMKLSFGDLKVDIVEL